MSCATHGSNWAGSSPLQEARTPAMLSDFSPRIGVNSKDSLFNRTTADRRSPYPKALPCSIASWGGLELSLKMSLRSFM